jgi:hypothetical protein
VSEVLLEKERLSLDELDAQAALELPDREMLGLITVVINNVLNDLEIEVEIKNVNVALQVCAVVSDINAILVDDEGDSIAFLTCEIQQK